MTISAQLKQLEAELGALAASMGGSSQACGDIEEVSDLLLRPGAPVIAVMFDSETPRDPKEGGMVDRVFRAVIIRQKGLAARPAKQLTEPTAAASVPLLDLVDSFRQVLRGIQFDRDTTEVTPDYNGARVFSLPDGTPTRAYQLEISIGVQLDAP